MMMGRGWPRYSAFAVCGVSFLLMVCFVVHSVFPALAMHTVGGMHPRVILPGHLVPLLEGRVAGQTLNSKSQVKLSVALKLRNSDVLNRLIAAQNDPHSALYHRYLTSQDFTRQFGPTE